MIALMLLMLVGGIGLSQCVSDPKQVTLQWLRLGGIISISLLAVAATALVMGATDETDPLIWGALLLVGVLAAVQLTATQLAKRALQRVAAAVQYLAAAVVVTLLLGQMVAANSAQAMELTGLLGAPVTALASAGLMGGTLMTMLLGHAYLTAGNEMTQAPFKRLVLLLGVLLVVRLAGAVVFGWVLGTPDADATNMQRMWNTVMIFARFAVGLLAPLGFIYMSHDCVKRHANQSATGILYVTAILVLLGEGIALALIAGTGRWL